MLLAPFFRLGLFDPLITPKLVSLVLVFLTLFVLYRTLVDLAGVSRRWASLALLLLALNPPFVIWTTSGLENPLYALLVGLLLHQTLRASLHPDLSPTRVLLIASLAAAAALTRPDGVLFAAAFPLVLLLNHRAPLRPAGGHSG